MNTINSATTRYVSQTTINVSSVAATRGDDDQQRSVAEKVRAHGRQHHGGAFMQDVVQTLQSFGLKFPGANNGSTADGDGRGESADASGNLGQLLQGFLRDLREVLKPVLGQSSSADVQADVVAEPLPAATATPPVEAETASPVSDKSAAASAPRAAVADVRHALHGFLHELRQALKYSADRRQAGADDQDRDREGRGAVAVGRNGYGKFTDNLQSLIRALSDNADGNGDKFKALQDGFSNLVNILGGATNAQKPTLLEFLNRMAGSGVGDTASPNGTGSIVSTKA